MKTIYLIPLALLLVAVPAAAQKKTSPYLDCKKSGRSEQDCAQYMDPHLRKAKEHREATAKKQMESLRRDEQSDAEWRRSLSR